MATFETDLVKEYRRQCHENASSRRRHWKRIRQMLKLAIGKTNYLKLKCRNIPNPFDRLGHYTSEGVIAFDVFEESHHSVIISAEEVKGNDGKLYSKLYFSFGHWAVSESGLKYIHHGGRAWIDTLSIPNNPQEPITRELQQRNYSWLVERITGEFRDVIHLELEKALQSVRVEKAGEFPKEAFEVSEIEKMTSINNDWI